MGIIQIKGVILIEKEFAITVRCAIVHEHNLLIVRHDINNSRVPHSWQLPGDTLEFGEKPEDAAVRIAAEHTGLAVGVKRALYVATFCPTDNKQIIIVTYLCTPKNTEVNLHTKYDEFKWAKPSRILVHLHSALATDFRDYRVLENLE